jgi:hypothetical protein
VKRNKKYIPSKGVLIRMERIQLSKPRGKSR